MKKIYCCLLALILVDTSIFADEIYQYTDKNGNLVFTNKHVINSKKLKLPPLTIYASPMTRNDYLAKGYTNNNKNNNKTLAQLYIAKDTAYNPTLNDSSRNQILSEELWRERQALDDTVQALALAKKTPLASEKNNPQEYNNRLQALQDAITEHQKNINYLTQQLPSRN